MMEEEKLRFQEEEGSFYEQNEKQESEEESEEEGEDQGDQAPVNNLPVVLKEADVPRFKNSASDLSALSYEMFVEQSKDTGDDNKEDNDLQERELENEETRELVLSPTSQRKVSEKPFCYHRKRCSGVGYKIVQDFNFARRFFICKFKL